MVFLPLFYLSILSLHLSSEDYHDETQDDVSWISKSVIFQSPGPHQYRINITKSFWPYSCGLSEKEDIFSIGQVIGSSFQKSLLLLKGPLTLAIVFPLISMSSVKVNPSQHIVETEM